MSSKYHLWKAGYSGMSLVSAERFLFLFVNNQIIEKKWENSSNDFYRFIEEILLFHSFYI